VRRSCPHDAADVEGGAGDEDDDEQCDKAAAEGIAIHGRTSVFSIQIKDFLATDGAQMDTDKRSKNSGFTEYQKIVVSEEPCFLRDGAC
jgi:hypothetical protein